MDSPPLSTSPDAWQVAETDTGQVYYYNQETNITQWKPPPEIFVEHKTDDGKPYYHNTLTNETLWEIDEDVLEYLEGIKQATGKSNKMKDEAMQNKFDEQERNEQLERSENVFNNNDLRLLVRNFVTHKFSDKKKERASRTDLLINIGEIYPMPLTKINVFADTLKQDNQETNYDNDKNAIDVEYKIDNLQVDMNTDIKMTDIDDKETIVFKNKLISFYKIYDPTVTEDQIMKQLEKYKGREHILLKRLAVKYKRKSRKDIKAKMAANNTDIDITDMNNNNNNNTNTNNDKSTDDNNIEKIEVQKKKSKKQMVAIQEQSSKPEKNVAHKTKERKEIKLQIEKKKKKVVIKNSNSPKNKYTSKKKQIDNHHVNNNVKNNEKRSTQNKNVVVITNRNKDIKKQKNNIKQVSPSYKNVKSKINTSNEILSTSDKETKKIIEDAKLKEFKLKKEMAVKKRYEEKKAEKEKVEKEKLMQKQLEIKQLENQKTKQKNRTDLMARKYRLKMLKRQQQEKEEAEKEADVEAKKLLKKQSIMAKKNIHLKPIEKKKTDFVKKNIKTMESSKLSKNKKRKGIDSNEKKTQNTETKNIGKHTGAYHGKKYIKKREDQLLSKTTVIGTNSVNTIINKNIDNARNNDKNKKTNKHTKIVKDKKYNRTKNQGEAIHINNSTDVPPVVSSPNKKQVMQKIKRPKFMCNLCGTETSNLAEQRMHDKECSYALVMCALNGCTVRVPRGQMVEHRKVCRQRYITCKLGCGNKVRLAHRKRHYESCEMRLVPCKQGCGKSVQAKFLIKHLRTECTERRQYCLVCGKAFSNSYEYKIHVKSCEKRQLDTYNSAATPLCDDTVNGRGDLSTNHASSTSMLNNTKQKKITKLNEDATEIYLKKVRKNQRNQKRIQVKRCTIKIQRFWRRVLAKVKFRRRCVELLLSHNHTWTTHEKEYRLNQSMRNAIYKISKNRKYLAEVKQLIEDEKDLIESIPQLNMKDVNVELRQMKRQIQSMKHKIFYVGNENTQLRSEVHKSRGYLLTQEMALDKAKMYLESVDMQLGNENHVYNNLISERNSLKMEVESISKDATQHLRLEIKLLQAEIVQNNKTLEVLSV